jgi:hypothetical protein
MLCQVLLTSVGEMFTVFMLLLFVYITIIIGMTALYGL